MPAPQANNRTSTNTQIRNFYAEGVSYMNTKFYNTSFAIALYPFTGKDDTGRSNFDKNGVATTISFEGAAALSQICGEILDNKIQEVSLSIPCFNASMILERKPNAAGQLETSLIITKNNITVVFPFMLMPVQIKENGVPQTRMVEAGLAAFKSTLDGYLGGINADRHLDKLTEDYVKTLGSIIPQNTQNMNPNQNQQQQPQKQYQPKQNYQNNGNYQNRNRQYQPRNNGNPNYQNKQNNWGPAQSFDSYNVPN